MKNNLNSVKILNITYRRPGISQLRFIADYGPVKRRGTIRFDTLEGKFVSHNKDINLLALICTELRNPATRANLGD